MDLSWVQDGKMFYLAGAVVAVFLGLIVAAFVQGREISIWPPRIGQHPAMAFRVKDKESSAEHVRSGTASSGTRLPISPYPPPANHHLFDQEFDVRAAKRFYQLIAPSYDLRNSGDLLKTHQQAIVRIERVLAERHHISVLDLGGGTGKNIATHFFNHDAVSWTYVDFAPAMVDAFQKNVESTKLGERAKVILGDISSPKWVPDSEMYDVIVLSFVLSSMAIPPDFGVLVRLLAPNGCLVVADADPAYTALNPYYAVPIAGEKIALRTNPVNPSNLSATMASAGLQVSEYAQLGGGEIGYSFISVFGRPSP